MLSKFTKFTWIKVAIALVAISVAGLSYPNWWPVLSGWVDATLAARRSGDSGEEHSHSEDGHGGHGGHEHDEHEHEHDGDHGHEHGHDGDHGHEHGHDHGHEAGHSEASALELSAQARANLGLTPEYLRPIKLSTYRRSISVPAVVVPKPGRSQIVVSSPLSGVVTHVHAVPGEAVMPGELLFEVRLTYEELVETQTEYLRGISELEVENREIARLEQVAQSGAVSGKSLLERQYAKGKLEAALRARREALKLHGLSDRQIDAIGQEGKLLRDLQIVAPDLDRHSEDEEMRLSQTSFRPVAFQQPAPDQQLDQQLDAQPQPPHLLVVDDLQVHKGQAAATGDKLCSLSDFTQLFIEGKAFEQDAAAIALVAKRGWKVSAVFPDASGKTAVDNLDIAFVGNSIDPNSRTLSVYVELPNEILSDTTNAQRQRFINWKYRLGQRLELKIPIEEWPDRIVLPVEAIAKDGADWFVFKQSGSHFHRTPVNVQYRTQVSAVIANDGSISPGDVIAMKSAHQLQMALKNKSGGGVDPHAGHTH